MAKKYKFQALIRFPESSPKSGYVVPPMDIKETFGKGRLKVKATFDGIPYRGSIVKMYGEWMLLIRKGIMEELGKSHGELIEVEFIEDHEERKVEIPKILSLQFKEEPKVKQFFNTLSYTHQKEYVSWISGAKKEETKQRRCNKTMDLLREGKKTR